MTFFVKMTSQSDSVVTVTYGDMTRDIQPGDSAEIIADDAATVSVVRQLPPVVETPPDETPPVIDETPPDRPGNKPDNPPGKPDESTLKRAKK